MARGKLILICQSGGEFVKNDDGSLTYTGGEAQAVNVNSETLYDDLKLKLAEMCNLDYKTVSIKYFLPGNTRTLISASNDKDLKRMLNFHVSSVTADVFVTGREGFSRDVLNFSTDRETSIKVAEPVDHVVAPVATDIASPVHAASPVCTPAVRISTRRNSARKKPIPVTTDSVIAVVVTPRRSSRANTASIASGNAKSDNSHVAPLSPVTFSAKGTTHNSIEIDLSATPVTADSVIDVDVTPRRHTRANTASNSSANAKSDNSHVAPMSPISLSAKGTAHSSIEIDLSATPADTVKKRRRTASWKIGISGPTIAADPDDDGEKGTQKMSSPKRMLHLKKDVDTSLLTNPDDASLDKLVVSWKEGITGIGQDFKNVGEFRDALQKYAIAHRFVYRLKKNESNRASGMCVADGCCWRIHASWVPDGQSFRIKKFNDAHTCGGESWKSAHPTKNWLVDIIKDRLRGSPHHRPKDIASDILRDFGIELNYTQVWRGIGDAREQLQGSFKEAYNMLSWYCGKIVENNPGSFAKLVIGDDKRFQCLFISFHSSIHGFQKGCRPLLFLDATSLKSKYKEVLLTATALDGNDGFFPVAFAVVDSENDDKWHWFLEQLKSTLLTSGSMTFVFDREKGLKESVLKVFENAHYGYSMYHLLKSFRKSLKPPFHGDGKAALPGLFLAAAHAIRLVDFKKLAEKIKKVSCQAYDTVMQIEPEHWTSTSIQGERHNHITDNVAESYIKLIEEARELPLLQKIDALILMIRELKNTRQTDSSSWCTELTPLKEEKLQEENVGARGLKVLFSSDTVFEVHDDSANLVVNLGNLDCTCLGWKTSGLPCRHAIAVFNCTRKTVYDYCSRYFTVDSFRLAYSESITPVLDIYKPGEKQVDTSDTEHVLPPHFSRSSSKWKENGPKDSDQPE